MVDLLLENGADAEACCVDGKAAMHCAAQMGHEAVAVRLLRHQQADAVNRPDAAGWTPLHYAAENGSLPLVEQFLQVSFVLLPWPMARFQETFFWIPCILSTLREAAALSGNSVTLQNGICPLIACLVDPRR